MLASPPRLPWLLASLVALASAVALSLAGGCFVGIPGLEARGSGGGGGATTDGGGGSGECTPGELLACYEGPSGTLDVGACREGAAKCQADATLGACDNQVLPAIESCDTMPQVADEDCDAVANDHCATFLLQLGAVRAQGVDAMRLAADGDILLATKNAGSIDFGGGAFNVSTNERTSVARLGPDGSHRWSVQLASMNRSLSRGITETSTGLVAVTGWFRRSITLDAESIDVMNSSDTLFVAALDGATGVAQWIKSYGNTATQRGHEVVASSDGIVVSGRLDGNASFGAPVGTVASSAGADALLFKLDETGATLWAAAYGGPGFDEAFDVAVDANDDVYVLGQFETSIDFGCASGPLTAVGEPDAFVAKIGSDGSCIWSRALSGDGSQLGKALAVEGSKLLVLGWYTGTLLDGTTSLATSQGGYDVFLLEVDAADGSILQHASFGGPEDQEPWDVAPTADGVVVVGSMYGSTDFGGGLITVPEVTSPTKPDDAFVVSLDASFAHRWSRRFGGNGDDDAFHVAVESDGHLLVAGEFFGTIDFGTGPVLSSDTDAWLVRLDP